MEPLIVNPENKEQLTALKAVLKSMKISFKQGDQIYPKPVIEGVRESIKEADAGRLTPYTGIRNMLNNA